MLKKNSTLEWASVAMVAAVLVVTFFTVAWHFPGHMSVDSVVQMYEGYTGQFKSYNPPLMSVMLGWSYAWFYSQGGFFLLNLLLFVAAVSVWLKPVSDRPFSTPLLFVCIGLYPIILSYNGAIWKDVLFANLSLLAFALFQRRSPGYIWWGLALLVAAAQIRQQGLLALLAGLLFVALAIQQGSPSPMRFVFRLFSVLVWVIGVHFALNALVGAHEKEKGLNPYGVGIGVLQVYDFAGTSREAGVRFPRLEKYADPALLDAYFQGYSPQRVDTLDNLYKGTEWPMAKVPLEERTPAWLEMIQSYPLAYLKHRWSVWRWQMGLEEPRQCLPFHLGVSDFPADYVQALGLKPGTGPRESRYYELEQPRVDTLYRPWLYMLASVLVVAILLWDGPRRHTPVLLLNLAALGYGASYFVIGIACDVRYMYFPILVAVCSLAYLIQVVGRNREMRGHTA